MIGIIVDQVKKHVPMFRGKVSGGLGLDPEKDVMALPKPSAYVVFLDDDAGEMESQSSYIQTITDKFGVIVLLESKSVHNTVVISEMYEARRQILRALAGFEIDNEPVVYKGCQLLMENRGVVVFQFDFSVSFCIGMPTGKTIYERLEEKKAGLFVPDSPEEPQQEAPSDMTPEEMAEKLELIQMCETWTQVSTLDLVDFMGVDLNVDSIVVDKPDGEVEVKARIDV